MICWLCLTALAAYGKGKSKFLLKQVYKIRDSRMPFEGDQGTAAGSAAGRDSDVFHQREIITG
jgi:hypothetical protein